MRLQDWMIFRLYIRQILLLLFAILVQFMANNLVETGKANAMVAVITTGIVPMFYWASFGLMAWSALWVFHSTWLLWHWSQGNNNEYSCHNCGGLVDMKNGRYGLYYRCLACGKTRSI